jgi:exonuclease VII large subunit
MMRFGIGILAAGLLISLAGCERSEPQGGGGTAQTPPTTTSPAPAATSQEALEKLTQLRDQMEQEAQRRAGEAKQVVVSIARQVREKYEGSVRDELARVDKHIQDLKQQLAGASEQARPALEKQIEQWSERARSMRDTLEKLPGAGDAAWTELKKGLDAAVNEVREALHEGPATQPATGPALPPATQPSQ